MEVLLRTNSFLSAMPCTAASKSALIPPWGKTLTDKEVDGLVKHLRHLCQCKGAMSSGEVIAMEGVKSNITKRVANGAIMSGILINVIVIALILFYYVLYPWNNSG